MKARLDRLEKDRLEKECAPRGSGELPGRTASRPRTAAPAGTSGPAFSTAPALALLVVDCSASMAGDKIRQASEGTRSFASRARHKGYRIGVVAFGCRARLVLDPTAEDRKSHTEAEDRISKTLLGQKPSGSTNLAAALDLCLTRVCRERPGAAAVVVATDGYPDDPAAALATGRKLAESGVSVLTIGTGDADHRFLGNLASATEFSVPATQRSLGAALEQAASVLPELPGS